uniref:Uncharacterized protein n=1 Tax=Lactuca sativa TaxID=4236 RepID=A0A9R1XAU4_LACSA|nr:hypothetical protein LSAT_V11C500252490 [Lactuca sativa]
MVGDKYFLYGEYEVGKQFLQDAADKGQLDAILLLGMLLMDKVSERKQEALITLNNPYISTGRSWNMRQNYYKVRSHLVREMRSNWLFNWDICFWDACLVEFVKMFDISLE